MAKKMVLTLATLLAASLAGAQSSTQTLSFSAALPTVDGVIADKEYGTVLDFGRVTVALARSADTLSIAVSGSTRGWVGVGLGANKMDGATIFIGYVANGALQLKPQRGSGHTHSDLTTDALIASAGRESDGRTTIELRLKSSAFLSSGQADLLGIVAIGGGDNFFSPHSFRAPWTVKLAS